MSALKNIRLSTLMPHKSCVGRWIQDASLSAQERRHHASIHFLCTFNSMGRGKLVRPVHHGDCLPSINDLTQTNCLKTLVQGCGRSMTVRCIYCLFVNSSEPPPPLFVNRVFRLPGIWSNKLHQESPKRPPWPLDTTANQRSGFVQLDVLSPLESQEH